MSDQQQDYRVGLLRQLGFDDAADVFEKLPASPQAQPPAAAETTTSGPQPPVEAQPPADPNMAAAQQFLEQLKGRDQWVSVPLVREDGTF